MLWIILAVANRTEAARWAYEHGIAGQPEADGTPAAGTHITN